GLPATTPSIGVRSSARACVVARSQDTAGWPAPDLVCALRTASPKRINATPRQRSLLIEVHDPDEVFGLERQVEQGLPCVRRGVQRGALGKPRGEVVHVEQGVDRALCWIWYGTQRCGELRVVTRVDGARHRVVIERGGFEGVVDRW